MSSLIVEVSRIQEVKPHPNAERLELAIIKGWQCVIPKGAHTAGDLVTYVPPDSVMPIELSDRLGITKYLSHGRVRCAKLRGEPSFGVTIKLDSDWTEGTDVAEFYGITKYVPPLKTTAGDAESPHSLFASYTEIENLRNFPVVLAEGEMVCVTEKLHGTNCRVGAITRENGEVEMMGGSKSVRRKWPGPDLTRSLYYYPLSIPGVDELLKAFSRTHRQVILFGEVYGKVQSLRYGLPNGIAFRAFDILIDGKYLNFDEFRSGCETYKIPIVPSLYVGPFSLAKIRELAEGPSTIPGANHIREGVVVRPLVERSDPKIGRVILKYIGDGYLLGDPEDSADE